MGNPVLINNGKWLKVFKQPSGWEFVSRKAKPYCDGNTIEDAVVIVPIIIDGSGEAKICIIEEWREPMQKWTIGFPAGLVEQGESIVQTIKRELMEETGLKMSLLLHITPPLWSSEGLTDECVTVAYVTCTGNLSTENLEASEKIRQNIVSRKDAADILEHFGNSTSFGKVAYFVLQDFVNTGFNWLGVKGE